MVGTIDTASSPIRYSGDGVIDGINLQRFGEGLEVAWLQDPRYAGTVSGRFRVEGAGSGTETLALTADGRISRAELFRGVLSDADVSLDIERGTLRGAFNGRMAGVDPAIPFADRATCRVADRIGRRADDGARPAHTNAVAGRLRGDRPDGARPIDDPRHPASTPRPSTAPLRTNA